MLRICTYNVRRFTGSERESSVLGVIEGLKQLVPVPDVICLNEVYCPRGSDTLQNIAKEMGKASGSSQTYSVNFFGHVQEKYGNAILFNKDVLNLVSSKTFRLPGGSKIKVPAGTETMTGDISEKYRVHTIVRGLVALDVKSVLGFHIRLLCTHLDHISEKERKIQMQYIDENLKSSRYGTLLIGDLNAMKRSDYSNDHWNKVIEHHRQLNYTPPEFGALEEFEKSGWIDCFETACQKDILNLSAEDKCSAHIDQPLYRIDHIMATPVVQQHMVPEHCFLAKHMTSSDHYPVVVDFKLLGSNRTTSNI